MSTEYQDKLFSTIQVLRETEPQLTEDQSMDISSLLNFADLTTLESLDKFRNDLGKLLLEFRVELDNKRGPSCWGAYTFLAPNWSTWEKANQNPDEYWYDELDEEGKILTQVTLGISPEDVKKALEDVNCVQEIPDTRRNMWVTTDKVYRYGTWVSSAGDCW